MAFPPINVPPYGNFQFPRILGLYDESNPVGIVNGLDFYGDNQYAFVDNNKGYVLASPYQKYSTPPNTLNSFEFLGHTVWIIDQYGTHGTNLIVPSPGQHWHVEQTYRLVYDGDPNFPHGAKFAVTGFSDAAVSVNSNCVLISPGSTCMRVFPTLFVSDWPNGYSGSSVVTSYKQYPECPTVADPPFVPCDCLLRDSVPATSAVLFHIFDMISGYYLQFGSGIYLPSLNTIKCPGETFRADIYSKIFIFQLSEFNET